MPLLITHPQLRLTSRRLGNCLQKYDGQYFRYPTRTSKLSVAAPKNLPVQVDLVEALGNETYLSVSLVAGFTPLTAIAATNFFQVNCTRPSCAYW